MKARVTLLVLSLFIGVELFAQEPIDFCQQGDVYLRDNQYLEAETSFQNCLDQDSMNIEVWLKLARVYEKLGQWQGVETACAKVLSMDSLNIQGLQQQASVFVKYKDYKNAAACYAKIIEQKPSNPFYYKKVAAVFIQSGQWYDAIVPLQVAFEINPKDEETGVVLAELLLNAGDHKSSDEIIGQLLEETNSKITVLAAAKLAYKQRHFKEAYQHLSNVIDQGVPETYIQMYGVCLHYMGNFDQSYTWLDSLLQQDLESENLYYYQGLNAYYLDSLNKAESLFNKAIELSISKEIDVYYLELGKTLADNGNYKAAIEAFGKAYEFNPLPTYLYRKAVIKEQYYADKSMALKDYQLFLNAKDTTDAASFSHAQYRVKRLKEWEHFQLKNKKDSL